MGSGYLAASIMASYALSLPLGPGGASSGSSSSCRAKRLRGVGSVRCTATGPVQVVTAGVVWLSPPRLLWLAPEAENEVDLLAGKSPSIE